GSLSGIVRATLDGLDGAPPLYAILVSGLRRVLPDESLAVRLPSTVGYLIMVVGLLAFCRRRMSAPYAFVPPLLVWSATLEYSSEGRPYGVVMGCAAAALLSWQAAVEGRRRNLALTFLTVSLMVMTAAHYYSVFFVASLCFAEL